MVRANAERIVADPEAIQPLRQSAGLYYIRRTTKTPSY